MNSLKMPRLSFVVLLCLLLLSAADARRRRRRPAPTTPRPGTCKGKPAQQSCVGPADGGTDQPRRTCRNRQNPVMWYYNAALNECFTVSYKGCGGNTNRWCTKAECESRCRQRPCISTTPRIRSTIS